MSRRHLVGLLLGLSLLTAGGARGQSPPLPPLPRTCEQDRDHARVLVRLIADGRGTAEWQLAEALAQVTRLEREVARLTEAAKPKPLEKKE